MHDAKAKAKAAVKLSTFTYAALGAESSMAKFQAMWDQLPAQTTFAMIGVPVGIALALLGRKHHAKLMLAIAFAIGTGGSHVLIGALRSSITAIPDSNVANLYVPIAFGVILAVVVHILSNVFYSACGVGLGVAGGMVINQLFKTALSTMPGYASTVILGVGAILGFFLISRFVPSILGVIYAILGGAIIAASTSLLTWPFGGDPELWPGKLVMDDNNVNLKDGTINWADEYTWISIIFAMIFVVIGLLWGEAKKDKALTESSPLLGDPEAGKAKNKK